MTDSMYSYSYDLHIHSCLSPCGDADMTPNNIVNMASIKNLDIIALCDHNTTKNCRAVINAAKNSGFPLLVIPAVEVTTSEDIHVLMFFRDIDSAEMFEAEVLCAKRTPVKNNPDIFGEQIIMDEADSEIGYEEMLLINAVDISIDEIQNYAKRYNAAAVPAHIDKESNGMLAILGMYADYLGFKAVEIKDSDKNILISEEYGFREKGIKILNDSDAHFLWDIKEKNEIQQSTKLNDIYNERSYTNDFFLYTKKEILSPSDFRDFLLNI